MQSSSTATSAEQPTTEQACARVELSAPYNWCDARCEQCPIKACSYREGAIRSGDGDRPDTIDEALDEMGFYQLLGDGAELFEQGIRKGIGHQLATGLSRARRRFRRARLKRAPLTCKALCEAVTRYVEEVRQAPLYFLPDRSLPAEAALEHAVLLFVTANRFSAYETLGEALTDDVLDGWHDNGANLLLLDLLDRQTAATIKQAAVSDDRADKQLEAFWEVRRAVRRQLDPWLAKVPEVLQRHVGELIAEGCAPSPFCIVRGRN